MAFPGCREALAADDPRRFLRPFFPSDNEGQFRHKSSTVVESWDRHALPGITCVTERGQSCQVS